MSCCEETRTSDIREGISGGALETLSDHDLQRHLENVVRVYSSRIENGSEISPFTHPRAVSATEVMVVVSRMLKATGIEVFELGMWQAWTGGR